MSQLTQSVSYVSSNGTLWTLEQFVAFVGVDLHKHTVTLVAVDPRQNVISHLTTSTKCVDQIEKFLRSLPRPVWMAVEVDGFIEWFLDRYGPVVDLISIADATELANRWGKRRKNDFNDAKDVGERLARGECPLGWIADPETARLRKLGRHWHQLSRTLRWVLGKAAMVLCRSDRTQEKIRHRLIRTTGKKAKANVAMARRLLQILFAMHRNQKPYTVGEPTNHQARANRARIKKQRSAKTDQAA